MGGKGDPPSAAYLSPGKGSVSAVRAGPRAGVRQIGRYFAASNGVRGDQGPGLASNAARIRVQEQESRAPIGRWDGAGGVAGEPTRASPSLLVPCLARLETLEPIAKQI